MINAQGYGEAGKVVAKYRADADGNIIWYETDGGEFVRYCAYEDGSLIYFECEGDKLIRYKSDANGNLLTDADGNYIAVTRYRADADGNIIYYNAAGSPVAPDKGEPKEWTEGSEGFWAYAEPAEGEYYFYKQVSGSANGQILVYDPADARLTQFDYGFNPIQYGGNAPANGAGWPVGENQDGAYADGATQQWQEGDDGNYSHLTTTRYIADENGNIYYYNANGERSTDPQFGTRREWSSSADGNWAYDLSAGEMVEDANGGMVKVEVNGFDTNGNPIFADGVNGVKAEASKDAYGNYLSGKPEDGESGSIIYYLTDENGDIIYFKADENGKVIYYQTNSNGYVIHGANGRPVEQTKYIADEDGNFILDAAGNKQVWTSEADGNYEYDKENGAPLASKVIADRDGNATFYVVDEDEDGNIYYLIDETGKRIVAEYGGKTYAAGDNAKYWAYDTVNGVPVEAPKDEYGNYISGKPLEKFICDDDGNVIYYKWDGAFVYEPGTTELQIAWKTDNQGREIYYEVLSDGTFGGLLTPKYVTDENGDTFEEYIVYHHKFLTWMQINGYDTEKRYSQEEIDALVEKSPYYKATSNDVDWLMKVKMQGRIQKWVDHSISVTINLPNDVDEELVNRLYVEAWKSGCKGCTVYRDGSRSGVLISAKSEKKKDEIPICKQPDVVEVRPKVLDADVLRFQNNKEKWVAFVGLLDGHPYEIFTGLQDDEEGILLPKSVTCGKIIKNIDEDGYKHYDFQFENKRGYKTTIEGLSEKFNKEYWNYAKLISGVLRWRMPIDRVIKLVDSLQLDSENINTWKNGVERALKKYVTDGTKAEGQKCPNCGQETLIYQEGCLICKNCGTSRCG